MMTRITKKDYYSTILDLVTLAEGNGFGIPEGMTYDGIAEFVNHEIELLEAKAASAAKRAAAKRAAGDELREMVLNTLSDTEFMTIDDIVAAIGNPDVTKNKVTARLTQLGDRGLGVVEKTQVTVEPSVEGGKSRKVSAYKRIAQ